VGDLFDILAEPDLWLASLRRRACWSASTLEKWLVAAAAWPFWLDHEMWLDSISGSAPLSFRSRSSFLSFIVPGAPAEGLSGDWEGLPDVFHEGTLAFLKL